MNNKPLCMKHRIWLLAVVMMALMGNAYAYDFSATAPSGQTLYFDVIGGHAEVVNIGSQGHNNSYSMSNWITGDLVIPDTVYYNDYPFAVTVIHAMAFRGQKNLTSVVVPAGVTTVENGAFYDCSNLMLLTVPSTVTSVGSDAFYGCNNSVNYTGTISQWCGISFSNALANPTYHSHKLVINGSEITEFVIPEGVVEIKAYAFYNCDNIKSVSLPSTLVTIGDGAFSGCIKLSPVAIPSSVGEIGVGAFSNVPMISGVGSNYGARCLNGYVENGLYFTDDSKTVFVGASPYLDSVIIPASVTEIAASALYGYDHLEYVAIPDSVGTINSYAFYGCTMLRPVVVPDSVDVIGALAFRDVPMVYYYGNATGTPWGARALNGYQEEGFYYTSSAKDTLLYVDADLTKAIIPDCVTVVKDYAFASCKSMTSITMGAGITWLAENAFSGCSADTLYYNAVFFTGFTGFQNQTKKYGLDSIKAVVFSRPIVFFPEFLIRKNKNLSYVDLGDSLSSIGDYAFSNCSNLVSVRIGDAVATIGNDAFYNCSSLVSVEIPNSVTSIGSSAFSGCSSLTSVTIPNSVTSIGSSAFSRCSSLASVSIPNSVTSIGSSAFYECSNLASVTIPDSVTSIGNSAFYKCSSLTSVVIPNSVASMGYNAFYDCESLHKVSLGRGLVSMGSNVFANTIIDTLYYNIDSIGDFQSNTRPQWDSVRVVYIGNNVRYIPVNLFHQCENLEYVVIGDSVTTIGNYAFYGCSSLHKLSLGRSINLIGNWSFANTVIDTLYYNIDSMTQWNQQRPPLDLVRVVYIGDNVHYMPDFHGCDSLVYVSIGDSVSYIPGSAFKGCRSLASVGIGNSVVSIGNNAFEECNSLSVLSIPNTVTSIGFRAFYNCGSLTAVNIPNSVTSIGSYAFSNCAGLVSLTIGNSVTSIGPYSFSGCEGLDSVYIPGSVAEIGYRAFYECSNLRSVVLNEGLTTIGNHTFYDCASLRSVVMPESVTEIGSNAFDGCVNMEKIAIPDGVESIESRTFYRCKNLRTLTIGRNVSQISRDALDSCIALDTLFYNADSLPDFEYGTALERKTPFIDSVRTIIMGDSVRYIPRNMLRFKCRKWSSYDYPLGRLEYLKIGGRVREVRDDLCRDMDSLKCLILPESLKVIGNNAFMYCSKLRFIEIPDSVVTIGDYAFSGCLWDSVRIGASVKHIGQNAFESYHTFSTNVKILYDADSLEDCTYNIFGSWLDTVVVGDKVRFIPGHVFQDKYIEHLTLGQSVEQIGTAAFAGNIFIILHHALLLPASLKVIGDSAFCGSGHMSSLVLPDSLVSIGKNAFDGMVIDTVFFPLSLQTVGTDVFEYFHIVVAPWEYPIDINGSFDLIWNGYSEAIVPCYAVANYMNDSVWGLATINGSGDGSVPVEENVVACSSYLWRDGNMYNDGDTASFSIMYEDRCDTMYTLHLRIQEPRQTFDTQYVCDNMWPYLYAIQMAYGSWEDYAYGPGYVEYTLPDIYGCDSLVGIEFVEIPTFNQEEHLLLCESMFPYYYAPQDTMIYRQDLDDGVYGQLTFGFSTVNGCDSVYRLDLTIRESPMADICMVTVEGEHNKVVWQQRDDAKQYNIYREGLTSGMYDLIAEVPSSHISEWVDTGSNAVSRSYRYRIAAVDSCDVESEISPEHKTMHLTINRGVGSSWNLVWSEYEGAAYSTYQIYRGSSLNNMILIDQMPAVGNVTYTDNNVDIDPVYYQVAIIKDEPCMPTKASSTIRSNVASNNENASIVSYDNNVEVRMYPNPATDCVNIESENGLLGVIVMDMTGRVIVEENVNTNDIQLHVGSYSAGVYVVKVVTTNGTTLRKLTVK